MEKRSETKYSKLLDILSRYPRAMVAFSGGTDSLLLLHALVDALGKDRVEAVIGLSPTLPEVELTKARRYADDLGVKLHKVETGVMDVENFTSNPSKRCYHCKVKLSEVIATLGNGDTPMLDGANVDDLSDYRPGLQVSTRLGVEHPLIEAEITKKDVRDILRFLGYPKGVYGRPSSPCLASRIPYGEEITVEKLKRIERAEDFLEKLGFGELRVRHFDLSIGPMAGIEIGRDDMERLDLKTRGRIVKELKRLGFTRIYLDLQGFRSGNLNEALGVIRG